MADNLNRLGGGVANAVALRGTPSVNNMSGKSEASTIVSGINELIQSVTKVKIAESIQRNEEDKIRAVSQAEVEHLDINNAMQGASYDNNLNQEVNNWRASGLLESEIRLKAKEYKYGKAVKDLKLDSGEREADDTDIAFFDTFNKLELKAITPLATEDRKQIQSKISGMTSSYLRTSDEPLQVKLNNVITTNKTYGMGEDEAVINVMQSAFDLARRGDESLLKQLPELKTSTGENIIDTPSGSEMYNKLTDNLMSKKEHDISVARKEKEFQEEVNFNKIYTDMIGSKDIHSMKLNADASLQSGKISVQQHKSLSDYYKTVTKEGKDAKKVTDRSVYINTYAKGKMGLLTMQDVLNVSDYLSDTDFEALARVAVDNGGANGTGSEEGKVIRDTMKIEIEAYSGASSIINGTVTSFEDAQLYKKREATLGYHYNNAFNSFVVAKGKLPDKDELAKMRDEAVKITEKEHPDSKKIKAKEPKAESKQKDTNVKPVADIKKFDVSSMKVKMDSFTTPQDKLAYAKSLTMEEREALRKYNNEMKGK